MSHFETLALSEAPQRGFSTPILWLRYVDDVLAYWTHSQDALRSFVLFLNTLRSTIRFSLERETNGELPFLDVLIQSGSDGLSFTVYRKPTHTDLYIRRTSAHPPNVFKGVVRAMNMRAHRVCSRERLPAEKRHLRTAFLRNGYSEAEIARGLRTPREREPNMPRRRFPLPYLPGVSDRIARILGEVDVLTAMRPTNTLRSMLVRKRPAPPLVLGSIYNIECSTCAWNYVGETGRTIEERKKEHLRAVREMDVQRSEVARHVIEDGHDVDVKGMRLIEKEKNWKKRVIKEALWTKKLSSSNKVMHDLGQVWTL